MDLFIPTKIHKEDKYANGVGKRELQKTVVAFPLGAAVGFSVTLPLHLETQPLILTVASCTVFFGAMAYYLFKRNSINTSLYDYLRYRWKFLRTQQYYPFTRRKEWY